MFELSRHGELAFLERVRHAIYTTYYNIVIVVFNDAQSDTIECVPHCKTKNMPRERFHSVMWPFRFRLGLLKLFGRTVLRL